MKRLLFCIAICLLSHPLLFSQDARDYQGPTNFRYSTDHLPWQVDLLWTPPEGWMPSAIDRWFDWDRGLWDGNALGSCMDCPAEAAVRWDAAMINMYDTVYLTKIRYVLTEPTITYALRVYQGTPDSFDTLMIDTLYSPPYYNAFDTLVMEPLLLDTAKDLWIGYWVNSLASGYPLPMAMVPANIGYGNMLQFYSPEGWVPLTNINPDIDYNWSIGGYLETPNDTIRYPVFNVYRAVDNLPFEKIHEGNFYDTIYYDYIWDLDPSHLYYFTSCVYEDGTEMTSDTLHISFVDIPEYVRGKMKVYPNPAKDRITIYSPDGTISSISIFNSTGKIVFNQIFNSEEVSLDVSGLAESFYMMNVKTKSGVYTSKLLIVR